MASFQYGSLVTQLQVTATAGSTTTLVNTSKFNQVMTGSANQTLVLPDSTTMSVGQGFNIFNQSSGTITLEFNGGSAFTDASGKNYNLISPNTSLEITLQTNGSALGTWAVIASSAAGLGAPGPTVQKFLSGSGTYTTPANVSFISVKMVGGGGGGGGVAGTGGNGGNTTFGTSLLVANGGTGAANISAGSGGTASLGSGPIGTVLSGAPGSGAGQSSTSSTFSSGGVGGATPFGGGGGGGSSGTNGTAPAANTGAGGGGAGSLSGTGGGSAAGAGGGAGGYIDAIIVSPAATYTYAIGAAGTAGSGTDTGGAGGSGIIVVTEYYFNGLGASAGNGGAYTPTVTKLTSGSGTYTTPANASFIRVRMAGGGGSGAGTGALTAGSAGNNTTFGTSLLLCNAGSGGGGTQASVGGAGGTASLGSGPIGTALTGGQGSGGSNTTTGQDHGGAGGSNAFGGSGGGGTGGGGAGYAATANTGGGGGGAGGSGTFASGGGGGAGGYIDAIIVSPAATYAYAVGASVSGGAGGNAGGASGSGYIEVTEYYNNGAVGTATNVTGIVAVANGGTGTSSAMAYYSGYMPTGSSWSTTSGSYVDGTNSGGNTLTQRVASGITVIAAASNVAGITFTPSSNTAVYRIKARTQIDNNTNGDTVAIQLTDGTSTIGTSGFATTSASLEVPTVLDGIYAPSTTSAVTVKLQIVAAVGGTARFRENTGAGNPSVEWELEQIRP